MCRLISERPGFQSEIGRPARGPPSYLGSPAVEPNHHPSYRGIGRTRSHSRSTRAAVISDSHLYSRYIQPQLIVTVARPQTLIQVNRLTIISIGNHYSPDTDTKSYTRQPINDSHPITTMIDYHHKHYLHDHQSSSSVVSLRSSDQYLD